MDVTLLNCNMESIIDWIFSSTKNKVVVLYIVLLAIIYIVIWIYEKIEEQGWSGKYFSDDDDLKHKKMVIKGVCPHCNENLNDKHIDRGYCWKCENFFDSRIEESESKKESKKSLNQAQKICIILMVVGFATWLVHFGWMPDRAAIGFVVFFGSLASFFLFKDK